MCTHTMPLNYTKGIEFAIEAVVCVKNFGRIFTTESKSSSSHTKKFCEKNAPKSVRISIVVFLKSPYFDEGFYRFDKTWLLFYKTYRH